MRRSKRSRLAARGSIAVAALVAGVALTEGLLRLGGYGEGMRFRRDPGWGYLMEPNQAVHPWGNEVRINRLGLRGPEVTEPKPPGVERVLFVGDSVTYGGGRIAEQDLFVRVFERLAREAGHSVEAVNLSAPGWSPQNWRRWIDDRGLLEADRVVLVLPECDLARPFATLEDYGFEREPPPLRLAFLLARLADRVWPLPASAMVGGAAASAMVGGAPATVAANAAAVEALRRAAGPERFVAVLVASAAASPVRSHWPRFEAAAGAVLDLRASLDPALHYRDGIHLSSAGHLEVGRRLFAAFEERAATEIRSANRSPYGRSRDRSVDPS